MYINSDNQGKPNSDIEVMNLLIDNVEPLLYENNVNIAFWGHNHCVQRQTAVYNKTVVQYAEMIDGVAVHKNPQATVHMVVGTGGAGFTTNQLSVAPEWSELVFYEWGYARVTVSSPTSLLWQWVNNTNGEVLDTMTMTQAYPIEQWSTSGSSPSSSTSHLIRDAIIIVSCLVVVAFLVIGYFYYHHKHHDDMLKPLLDTKEIEGTDIETDHSINPNHL